MCAHRAAVPRLVVTICLNPPSQQQHTRLLSSVCATSTEDKRCNHGTTFPDSSGFQPSLKAQKISYMLANCTRPTSTRHPGTLAAQESLHCWEQGKGSKVLGEVQRGRSDFHKEL